MPDAGHDVAAARLRERKQRLIDLWEQRVRERLVAARGRERPVLLDSLPELIDRVASLLDTPPTPDAIDQLQATQAAAHGRQRARLDEYSLAEVIDEYQLLGRTMIEVLDEDGTIDVVSRDAIRESIVSAIRGAASEFARHRSAAAESRLRVADLQFRHMVEAVKDYAIFTLDPKGHITSWNDGCIRMKQYSVDEAVGSHFSMLYPDEGKRRDEPMGHLRTAAIEGRFRGEGVRVRKNGELFLADVSITAIYEQGSVVGFTKVVQDLTERTALVQERDLSRSDTERLRSEAEYRKRFVTTLTHDLRSPLAAAKTGAELIAQFPDDTAKVRAWATRSADALDRAARMIADLLDASRLHAGHRLALEFEPCDLRAIAEDLCEELAQRHGERFRIETSGETTGWWSGEGLRRALDNLLSNAVKYGDRTQPITVRMRRVEDHVIVSVHNFGTIIPAEEQAKLFEPFHRTEDADLSGQPGWGIGLALVRGIAEAHGGMVKAESYPIEGTTFTIDLPVVARRQAA